MKTIIKRMQKPTPAFLKKVRNAGLAIAGIGATILAAPIVLPGVVIKIASYIALAGGVMSAVSQSAVKMETN